MKIVGLVGPKRSGKDTAAAGLVGHRGYVRAGFADAVKELALRIDPIIPDDYNQPRTLAEFVGRRGWEEAKSDPEVRRFLQALGTDGIRAIDEDFWISAWTRTVSRLGVHQRYEGDTLVTGPPNVVVPDVRFRNEAEALRGDFWVRGPSLLIRIYRPMQDDGDRHVSETEQSGIRCDAALVNDGTPEQLQAKVLALVDEWSTS